MTATAAAGVRSAAPDLPQTYRADIEGLRGVAVLSVFAVHSVPQSLAGGFIGVDVFFVLSGYLIASISLAEIARGRFGVLDFYVRRLRRLAPALLVVLLACLAFAAFRAYPRDAQAIGHHVAAGALFLSNILLWTEGGYFDPSAERKMLLHLWSLGIEEQFYVLWPMAALLLARLRRGALVWVGLALLISFGLNVLMVGPKPKATFFLPPTRFWELLMGVMLAYWSHHMPGGPVASVGRLLPGSRAWQRHLADGFALAGVLLLVVALVVIDKDHPFPGWWALLPTTGTVLLVAAGGQAWVNRVVLRHPVLTFYGQISYPLYLWHWPLLTLPVLLDEPLSPVQHVVLLAACVALAAATCYGVERPLRFGRAARWSPAVLGAGLLVAAALGWSVYRSEGRLDSYPEAVREIARVDVRGDYDSYRIETCFLRSEQGPQAFGAPCAGAAAPGRPLWLLWGDSHAAALYPGLAEAARTVGGGRALAQYTAAACPPGWAHAVPDNLHCAEVNAHVLRQVAVLRPHGVVLAANWSGPGREVAGMAPWRPLAALHDVVAALRRAGVTEVIVVGSLPRWQVAPPRRLLKAWSDEGVLPERSTDPLDAAAVAFDRQLRETATQSGARYLSLLQAVCGATGCPLAVRQGSAWHAVAFDTTHLTAVGSRFVVRALSPWTPD